MALINQDLSRYEGRIGFEVLPAGWYEAIVSDSKIKEGPQGNYINWEFEIVGKPNRIWDVMSMSNEVAMSRLKSLALACGHHNPNFLQDTEELHGRTFMVRLKIEKDDDGNFEPKNKATAFKPIDDNGDTCAKIPKQGIPAAVMASTHKQSQPQTRMPWQK